MDIAAMCNQMVAEYFPGHIGMEFLEVGPELVSARMEVSKALCNPVGILHGGAIMSLADTLGAVGAVMNLPEDGRSTTTESKTNFISSVPEGGTVKAVARPVHIGKTLMIWQTTITNGDGRLVALVTQSQMVLDAC